MWDYKNAVRKIRGEIAKITNEEGETSRNKREGLAVQIWGMTRF